MKKIYSVALLLSILAILPGCGKDSSPSSAEPPFRVGFMPKLVGIPYFNACKKGAEEAAKELKIKLDYNGPSAAEANPQIDLLNQWIASGDYDCLCVACNDPHQLAPVLGEAKKKGILVVTYDADTTADARHFFVNQGTYDDVAQAMVDAMAEELEPMGTGKVGILTSSVEAPNQSQWARRIKAYAKEKYPKMELLAETEHGEDRNKGISQAKALIQANKDLKGIIGLTSVAVPAAAEAVRQLDKKGAIKVTGVSTPKDMRDYLMDDTVKTVILWNPVDLGYLAVQVAHLHHQKKMPETGTIQAGRLGEIGVNDREVLLGKPIRINNGNVDSWGF